MFSYEESIRAVQLYIKHGKRGFAMLPIASFDGQRTTGQDAHMINVRLTDKDFH